MRKLEKEQRRKMKLISKRTSKRIFLHQIQLSETDIGREIMASFHTDPNNFGVVLEKVIAPYSISMRNLFY